MLLLIDNYDSFTYNLFHYLGQLGAETVVRRNDEIDVQAAMALRPSAILLSPGPCDPDRAGVCLALIAAAAETATPLLGVCLGHQAIGQAFGGRVVRAPAIMHGKLDAISHDGTGVFAGLPSPFSATRYHSLTVARRVLSLRVGAYRLNYLPFFPYSRHETFDARPVGFIALFALGLGRCLPLPYQRQDRLPGQAVRQRPACR